MSRFYVNFMLSHYFRRLEKDKKVRQMIQNFYKNIMHFLIAYEPSGDVPHKKTKPYIVNVGGCAVDENEYDIQRQSRAPVVWMNE